MRQCNLPHFSSLALDLLRAMRLSDIFHHENVLFLDDHDVGSPDDVL